MNHVPWIFLLILLIIIFIIYWIYWSFKEVEEDSIHYETKKNSRIMIIFMISAFVILWVGNRIHNKLNHGKFFLEKNNIGW